MQVILTEDEDFQPDVTHWVKQMEMLSRIRKWLQLNLANGIPCDQIPKKNARHNDLVWSDK